MKDSQLIDLMVSAGVSRDEATRRTASYIAEQETQQRLEKSISTLEEVAEAQRDGEERHLERLHKARTGGEMSLASTIAPALDDLLTEQRAQNDALAKGLTGLLELVKGLRGEVKALQDAKSTKSGARALVKSVDYIPSPHEERADATRDQLFKALSSAAATEPQRSAELLRATALLESGGDPAAIASQFALSTKDLK